MCVRVRRTHTNSLSPQKSTVEPLLEEINSDSGSFLAKQWGFGSRSISPHDLAGHWFVHKDRVVTWLARTPFQNVWDPHLAINPRWRGRAWPLLKCWAELIRRAFELTGRPGLLCANGDHPDLYRRLGFTWDPEYGIFTLPFGVPPWENTLELFWDPS